MLGEGAFGIVVQAEAMGICAKNVHTTVAVKMLKGKLYTVNTLGFSAEY